MATLTEGKHAGEFLISEANGFRSREQITVASGAALDAGTVLGLNRSDTVGAAAAVTGNTGNGTVGSLTAGKSAESGTYTLTAIDAETNEGEFQVLSPSGVVVGVATVGVAFASDHLNFTIADGSTDFAVDDAFTIAVSGTGKYAQLDEDAVTGLAEFGGILWDYAGAASADVVGAAIVRDAEVRGTDLTWPATITTDEKNAVIAQAAAVGVIIR